MVTQGLRAQEFQNLQPFAALLIPLGLLLAALPMSAAPQASANGKPLRLAIAGLVHGHVSGFLNNALRRPQDVQLVGVFDPDAALGKRYAERQQNGFPASLLFTDLDKMLDTVKPEAVATFTDTFDHAMVSRHVPSGTSR